MKYVDTMHAIIISYQNLVENYNKRKNISYNRIIISYQNLVENYNYFKNVRQRPRLYHIKT